MTRISKLTAAQEVDLARTYREWLDVGRSVAPVDRSAAVAVIGEMYAKIGLPQPAVLFFSSPAACILGHGVIRSLGKSNQLSDQLSDQLRDQLRDQLSDQLWGQLRGQLWDQLRDQLRDQLWGQLRGQLRDQLRDQLSGQLRGQLSGQLRDQLSDQLRDQLSDQLWGQLRGQLWDQLRGQLRGQLRDQLRDQLSGQLRGQLRDQLHNYFAGQHWCAWEVFYDCCRRIGVRYSGEQDALLDLWLRQSRSCHWWWPYRGVVLASERHSILRVDERGRLHAADGPAVAYPDGWVVWAWHGLRVSRDVIERPETITVRQIEGERNAELRRVLCERYGAARYLADSGAKVIDRVALDDTRVPFGVRGARLLFKEVADDEPLVMVELRNSTPDPDGSVKTYTLRVPPDMRSCLAAVAWTCGKVESEYAPAVES